MMNIGKLIKEYRDNNGLTTEELALILGVSKGQVSKWETGSQEPSTDQYYHLSQVMMFPLDEFIKACQSDSDDIEVHTINPTIIYNVGINRVFYSIHDLDTLVDFLQMMKDVRDFYKSHKPLGSITLGHDITTEKQSITADVLFPLCDFNYDDPSVLELRIFENMQPTDIQIKKDAVRRIVPKIIFQNSSYIINLIIEVNGKGELIQFCFKIFD